MLKNVYIGSIGAAYNEKALESAGITHILTVANKIKPRFESKFIYLLIPCKDTPDESIIGFFSQSNEFITKSLEACPTNKVLIHCFAGKSRATSFTLAYLIAEKRYSLKDGLEKIWMCRP